MGRLQTRLALGELLARTRRIELAGRPVLAPFPVHGPMHLPLALHPALPSSTAGDL